MSQTLLAVLSLALLSFLAFASLSDRNDTISEHARALVREEARGLSAGLLEQLTTLPFQTAVDGRRPLPEAFGPPPGSSWEGDLVDSVFARVADLDDVHALENLRAEVLLEHPVSGLENPLVFETGFAVDYVRLEGEDWRPVADTTAHKRVTLRVHHPSTDVAVELHRLYSDLDRL